MRFSNASQRRAPIGRWVKNKKADIEYPFTHGDVINQLPERKETAQGFPSEANDDFKTVTEFNGCDRRKLRMDQQHCSYSTILT